MALPLQLFEVADHRGVYFFDAVHDDEDGDGVRVHSTGCEFTHIILDALDGILQHSLVLAVHAHTDGQLQAL